MVVNDAMLGQRARWFPDLAPAVYAAHAAFAPLLRVAADAVQGHLLAHATRGFEIFREGAATREALRVELGALLGVPATQLAFAHGTTAAVIAVAQALAWRSGDGVLTLAGEFPANVTPWLQVAEQHRLAHDTLPADAFADARGLELLEQRLTRGGVRLVAVSAVQFQTGLRMPLEAMAAACHRHGALLFVDAIQAAGVVPLDLVALGVDLAVGGGHKWLCGLDGAGWIYVAEGREALLGEALRGWLSCQDGARFLVEGPGQLRYDRPTLTAPRVFEGGSSSTVALVALLAGVRVLRAAGIDAIYSHVQRWHDLLEPGLSDRGFVSARAPDPTRRSGILAVRPPPGNTLPELQRQLAARGVIVNIPDGWLRIAPHFANSLDEPATVLAALDDILA